MKPLHVITRIRLHCLLLACALVLGIISCASSSVFYVTAAGNDSNPGTNWQSARRSIKAALDLAASGDQVWVAAGVYQEMVTIEAGVQLLGGFPAGGGSPEIRNPQVNSTEINGGQLGSVVKFAYGAGRDTLMDGFTIRNGRSDVGGGIYCFNSSPTITNNRIKQNYAIGNNAYGAGICCEGSSPVIRSNIIESNSAMSGGGVFCSSDSNPVIENNTFNANFGSTGGGIYCADFSSPTIKGNTISGNGSAIYCEWHSSPMVTGNNITKNNASAGAAVYISQSSPTVSCNLIYKNTSTNAGGGIFATDSSPVLTSNTVDSNTSTANTGSVSFFNSYASFTNNIVSTNNSGIYNETSSALPTLAANCVFANTAYSYSGITPSPSDISADPCFVGPTAFNYHLKATSPCINKGTNWALYIPVVDFDGNNRIWAGTVDMGAFEMTPSVNSLSFAKGQPDGSWVGIDGAIISAAYPDIFYIENIERTSGIRVYLQGHLLTEGQRVNVTGTVLTNPDGERYIKASTYNTF